MFHNALTVSNVPKARPYGCPRPVKLLKHSAMKKIRYIALLLSIAAAALSASAATKQFTLAFDENDFRFSTNEYGELVIQPADPMSTMPAGGLPALPQFSTVIAVGERQTYKSHEISVSKRLVRSGIVMEPAQFAVPTDSIFAGAKFERVFPDYDLAQYPADNCEYATTSHWAGGVSTLHFLSCPFVYNPEGGELYFIDSMTLTVELDETPAPARVAASSSSAVRHETPWFVHDMVINPDDIPSGPQRISSSSLSGYVDPYRADYVIITSEALKPYFEPLATWKKAKGVPSKIITIEEIDQKFEGKDQQLRIKKCLKSLYDNRGLKYVLLGGDDTVVPVRGCYGEIKKSNNSQESDNIEIDKTIPTDMYYACFGGNFEWNYLKNDIYGEYSDRIDLNPSIFVTRLPIRIGEEATKCINKIIAYEQNPQINDSILMCGAKMFVDHSSTQSDSEAAGEYLYNTTIKRYITNRTRFYDTHSDVNYGTSYNITAKNLESEMSKGYYFIDATFHGSQTSWVLNSTVNMGNSFVFDCSDVTYVHNKAHSIITTMACSTNAFDCSDDGEDDPCLSEAFIRSTPSGVIAYLGCSRKTWFTVGNINGWFPLKYESAFYNHIYTATSENRLFGPICAAAKADLITQSAQNGAYRWIQFGLNPIGDPEMPIYLKRPLSFNNAKVTLTKDTMLIQTGVPNCDICVMSLDDNGESYYKIFNNIEELKLTDYPQNTSICISNSTVFCPRQFIVRHMQNQSISGIKLFKGDIVLIGSSIYSRSSTGDVIIEKGKTHIRAPKIVIDSGLKVKEGAGIVLEPNR